MKVFKELLSEIKNPSFFAGAFAVGSFFIVFAFNFDVWWHRAIGRDSFFIPPHVLVLTSYFATTLLSLFFYLYYRRNFSAASRALGHIVLAEILFGFGFIFDNSWHQLFGQEKIDSPLIVWGPPHVFMEAAFIYGQLAFIKFLASLKGSLDELWRRTLATFSFALIFSDLAGFFMMPVWPLDAYRTLGLYGGAFMSAFLFVLVLSLGSFLKKELLPFWGVHAVIFFFFFEGVKITKIFSPLVKFPYKPFDIPIWIHALALLVSVLAFQLLADFFEEKKFKIFNGFIFGFFYGGIFYPVAKWWIDYNHFLFEFHLSDAAVMILLSALGGALASWLISFCLAEKTYRG